MTRDISNSEDVLDSRDIIARIEELEAERHRAYDEYCDAKREIEEEPFSLAEWIIVEGMAGPSPIDDEMAELAKLQSFMDEMKGYGGDEQWRGDWYPVTLIRHSYFKDYAQELAEDIGAIQRDASWPNGCIDWDEAASQLKMDYGSADFDGVEYYYR